MRTGVLAGLAVNRIAPWQGQLAFFAVALTAVTALAVVDLRLLIPALMGVVAVGEIWGRGAQIRREAANKQAERERETQRRKREEQKRKTRRQREAEGRAHAEQEREAGRRRQQADEEREADSQRQRQRSRTARPGETAEDWWVVLGVSPNASKEEIVRSYRRKVLQNHPDRVAGLAPEFTALADSRMKAINAAYARAQGKRR
jgi:DnaJ-domain-containing protein 1